VFCRMTYVFSKRIAQSVMLTSLAVFISAAPAAESAADCPTPTYVFSWAQMDNCGVTPRGGITTGPAVTLADTPSDAWKALQEPGLSSVQKDRRAILALAGDYRVNFEFLETIGYTSDYKRPKPYQSWATERVYVIADDGDFISLQHIMVMYFQTSDPDTGQLATQGPVVMKHWRQDWRYQDRDLFVFGGDALWQHRQVPENLATGRWSQAVYQVDDAPRYKDTGFWQHGAHRSIWQSGDTWRPLPRREASVRDDYDVLVSRTRITVLPTGWVHGQDNEKLVLDDSRRPMAMLAREQGVDRYQRIVDFDFVPGDEYWRTTSAFWAQVRDYWAQIERQDASGVRIENRVDGTPHYAPLFGYAERLMAGETYDPSAAQSFIEDTLSAYVDVRSEP